MKLLTNNIPCSQLFPDTQLSRNMNADQCLKGAKRKGSGEDGSSLHSLVRKLEAITALSHWLSCSQSSLFKDLFHSTALVNVLLQDQTSALLQKEVSMECADEKASDSGTKREDYVHVRAKRVQATNSHSLAERVMFLLGNIINYLAMLVSLVYPSLSFRNAVSEGKDK